MNEPSGFDKATYEVQREAFGEPPSLAPGPGDSLWLGDYKRADNGTQMLMLADLLSDLWQKISHLEGHVCPPSGRLDGHGCPESTE